MATLAIINKMIPVIYDGSFEVETFIEECKRYFSLLEQEAQNMMIKCLIARDLLPIYEAVEEKELNFENRLLKAFKKPTTLIGDFLSLCNYEKDTDIAPVYFEKIEKVVEQLFKHKWDKNELIAYFLVHCVKDKDTQKEIKMREALKVEEIKEVIRKVDTINMEVSGIASINRKETFANVVRKRQGFADIQDRYQRNVRNEDRNNVRNITRSDEDVRRTNQKQFVNSNWEARQSGIMKTVTCWNCQEVGHMSRECSKRRNSICFGCGKEGHIRRDCRQSAVKEYVNCNACKESGHHRSECPSISCSGCGRRGHLRFQCWNQTEKKRYIDVRERRQQNLASLQREEDEENDDARGNEYPNIEAPSCDEMIGAMN